MIYITVNNGKELVGFYSNRAIVLIVDTEGRSAV